jgi:hypothetical protein
VPRTAALVILISRALEKQTQANARRSELMHVLHNAFISEVRQHVRERDCLQNLGLDPAVIPGCDPELSYRVRELEEAFSRLPACQREIECGFRRIVPPVVV